MIVVCAIDRPRSAIISTRSRKLSLKRKYHLTHSTMISQSKWRPSNSSSKLRNPAISPPQSITALRDREPAELHQSPFKEADRQLQNGDGESAAILHETTLVDALLLNTG